MQFVKRLLFPASKTPTQFFSGFGIATLPGKALRAVYGQKKTEVALCLLIRASQASRPGFRLAPRVVSPHPRWVANCYLCRLSATLFYLSTLPPVSPSLPSAVGRSSVPVGIGNITKVQSGVNPYLRKNDIFLNFFCLSRRQRVAVSAGSRPVC